MRAAQGEADFIKAVPFSELQEKWLVKYQLDVVMAYV